MIHASRGTATTYRHTQRGPWCLLLYAMAVGFLVAAWFVQLPELAYVFALSGVILAVVAASFHYLAVEDEFDRLVIRFGPLPFFRRSISYDNILDVQIGQTTFLDGWGIHMSMRGGWVWNIWGYDCVELRLRKGMPRVGTDDPQNLAAFLQQRLSLPHLPAEDASRRQALRS
jgi:hypothetical protein